jgi:hypothetical protein
MRSIRRQNRNKFFYIIPIVLFLYSLYQFLDQGIASIFPNILIDVIFFVLSFFTFILIFSFFLFPNTEITNLLPILHRVFLFLSGKNGSINHVKNGKKIEMNGISSKSNPGLVLLDSSSAAIIGKTTRFHRAVGPGIVFTNKNETLTDSVDLRIQKHSLGPLENENPYLIRQQKEKSNSYDAQVQRASETKVITRDGIEIIASFSLTFKIRSKPGEGNTPFGYNPLSVERAILGQTVDHKSGLQNEYSRSWTELPGLLAVDIWRELIHKYKLNELFQINGSSLDYCLEYMHNRLAQQRYEEIDEFGNRTGIQISSKEYQFLEDRGIEFLEIQLKRLYLPPDIEDGLVNRWESAWSTITTSEKKIISRLRGQAITDGKTSGQELISELITQIILGFTNEGTLTPNNLISRLLSARKDRSRKEKGFPEDSSNNTKKSSE